MSIKRFDGSNWVDAPTHKRFDGSNWVDAASVKRFDGSNWIETAKNVVSPQDVIKVRYTYTEAYYQYQDYRVTCTKCNKPIFDISREIETSSFRYSYFNDDGVYKGQTVMSISTLFYRLQALCQYFSGANGVDVSTNKAQFKAKLDALGYAYSYFDNMRYHENGSTRNLFTSDGYLICPWCE